MKALLREMTASAETLLRSVMMSSVMPSLKYSCSASPLMLANGSTQIDSFRGWSALSSPAFAAPVSRTDREHMDRTLDVLHRMLAHILERAGGLAFYLIPDDAGEGYAAHRGERLEPRSHVDALRHRCRRPRQ